MRGRESKANKRYVTEVKIEKFIYRWDIKNFRYLIKQPGEYLDTPDFVFGFQNTIKWSLRLYPNGENEESKNYLSLYALCKKSNVEVRGDVILSLIYPDQDKFVLVEAEDDLSLIRSNWVRGYSKIIDRDTILDEESNMLSNGCLTIQCEIVLSLDNVTPVIEKKQLKLEVSSRPSWFENLFLQESHSDIRLIATSSDDKSLPAHRHVLSALSPVFNGMFTHNMLEKNSGEVRIDDVEYEIMKEMLRFIYLGEVENIKSIVFELVKLADKYEISGLIELCQAVMIDEISVDNVFDVITIADTYNMEELKEHATEFGRLHLKKIVNSDNFDTSMYPQALNSILKRLVNNEDFYVL